MHVQCLERMPFQFFSVYNYFAYDGYSQTSCHKNFGQRETLSSIHNLFTNFCTTVKLTLLCTIKILSKSSMKYGVIAISSLCKIHPFVNENCMRPNPDSGIFTDHVYKNVDFLDRNLFSIRTSSKLINNYIN